MDGLVTLFSRYDVLGAFWVTIQLTLFGALGALLIGTVVAICRVSPVTVLQNFGAAFVTVLRNTPLTLLVTLCSIGLYYNLRINLAEVGSRTELADNALRWAVVALAFYHAAFVAEAIRSGINTVPVGQAEAARSIGLSFGPTLRHVILPQAFRGAIAPLGNTLIALTKNTTVAATVGVAEASYMMKNMIEFDPALLFWIFFTMATGFVILTLPMGVFFTFLSNRLAVQR